PAPRALASFPTRRSSDLPLLARIEARHLRGSRSRVSVLQGGKELAGQDISIEGDPFFLDVPFSIKAEKPGLQRLVVQVRPVEGEDRKSTRLNSSHVKRSY